MEKLACFDANASFGRRSLLFPGSFTKKETLLRQMEIFGIQKALVYHSLAKEYDPQEGNKILMQEIADEPRLVPLWAVLPHYTGEFYPPWELIRQMKEQNVHAVTLFPAPSCHNFSLSEITCSALFEVLEVHRIPLFIGMDQLGGMENFGKLVSAHPNMKIVLTNVNFRIDRDLYPLMEKYENFQMEISGYKPLNGISFLCRRFGAHRLLFGSGMPYLSCAASIGLLTYADISDEEKKMIASENLETLLGGVQW